jgi:heterodisulfide reductase subunit B
MSYIYYPGCSLKGTGRAYEESILEVFKALNHPLTELEDWNCCGATAYMSISELKAFTLCARNLALAERQDKGAEETDLVVPCAACYLGLNKAWHYLNEHADIRATVDNALQAAGLTYEGRVRIRHPLDIFVNDLGIDKLSEPLDRSLEGLRVACYYGCQLVRPYSEFDDQHNPSTMETVMKALGAEIVDWPLKTRCCGGALTGTIPEVGLKLSYILLNEAKKRGCDVIVTACPLCQFNLECYQSRINKTYGNGYKLPVAFFTQLMGLAYGIDRKKLGIQRLFVPLRQQLQTAHYAGGEHVRS